jgi:cholesterol oxidase
MGRLPEYRSETGLSFPRISRPAFVLRDNMAFDVVVVGSGYGGSIAASRMARAGFRVCLLERGREIRPGQYPSGLLEAIANTQVDMPSSRHIGSKTALYDLRINKDIHVFIGCGLGGTSLVNANVALRADPRVFRGPLWPEELRNDSDQRMLQAYERAEQMLQPTLYPRSVPKLEALEISAQEFAQGEFYRLPINVTFEARKNEAGLFQAACNDCGNCVSGCNVGAKNTTLMNYLPDAYNHRAEIYTEANVNYITRNGDGQWNVHFETKFKRKKFIHAGIVILGGGTLGSTEILLRSREEGLRVSSCLGHRFTGNGDFLGIGYNTDFKIRGVALGKHPVIFPNEQRVGPTITGAIDLRRVPIGEAMIIEEGAIPAPLGQIARWLCPWLACLCGRETERSISEFCRQVARGCESAFCGPYTGAMRNTQTYLVMSHDDDGGQMYLENNRLRIAWPHVGEEWNFKHINQCLEVATKPLGGVYLKEPIWTKDAGLELITVHPLGGCIMADCAERGVVNHKGLVFDGTSGPSTHKGLYVCDGSTIPTSLGVNPLLTISALAERCCSLIAEDYHRQLNYSREPAAASRNRTGLGSK